MKIVCDSCGAKYSIADEKVQGKVFKIRCKKCSEVIVVKGNEAAGEQDQGYGGAYGGSAGAAEWYVVIDGERVGPITPEEVEGYFTAGTLHSETFVWRDGLEDWVMLSTLSEFAHLTHDAAGPEEKTMIASRSSVEEEQPAYETGAADGYGGYSGYDAGYQEEDAGDSTMVMDPSKFQPQENSFQDFGAESAAAVADPAPVDSGFGGGGFGDGGFGDGGFGDGGFGDGGSGGYEQQGAVAQQDYSAGVGDSGGYDSSNNGLDSGFGDSGFDSGGFDDGGGYDSGYDEGGYDDGGYDDGGGMFAAFDSGAADDQGYDDEPEAAPDLSGGQAEDLVGARNENSVLFSLSSVDQVKAVNKSGGPAGHAEGNDKSGLIDIQALASTHAAMSGAGQSKDDDDEFVAGTMSMPALMPMGSHKKSNKGLLIGVGIAGGVLVVALISVLVAMVVMGGDDAPVQEQPLAAVDPEPKEEEEEELTAEEKAEAEAAAAAAQAALEAEKEEEEEKEEAEEEPEERAVAQAQPRQQQQQPRQQQQQQPRQQQQQQPRQQQQQSSGSDILDRIGSDSGSQQQARRDLPENLSRSMVQNTIRRYTSQVNNCSANNNSDGLSGNATIRFVVQGNGSVSSASAQGEFAGSEVGRCIEGVVRSMRFPETQDDSRTINYPFRVR